MSFRLRKRNGRGGKRAALARAPTDSFGRTDATSRWEVPSRVSSRREMPRLGPVLLAIVVVTVLTFGLHMLYQ
jgi:hypothetical protein